VPQFQGILDLRDGPDILFSGFHFKASRPFVVGQNTSSVGALAWSDLSFTGGDPALFPHLLALAAGLGPEDTDTLDVAEIKLLPIDAHPLSAAGLRFKPVGASGNSLAFHVSSVTPTTGDEIRFTLNVPLLPGASLALWPCLGGGPPPRTSDCPPGPLPTWLPDPRPAVAAIALPSGAASPLTFYSLGAQQSAGTPSSALGFTAFRFTKAIDEVLSGRLWIALHDRKTLGTVTIAAQGGATYTLFDTHVTEIEIVAEKLGGVPPSEHVALGFTKICVATATKETCWDLLTNTGSGGQP
jgi:hypothetical protein